MLLTITYKGKDTQDLGYMLFKNPNRPQSVKLTTGSAYVYYPKVSDEETTIALLLDINSLDLAKGEKGKDVQPQSLFDYVNDRPYVASSFLATAMNKVFGTAISGRGDEYQELVDSKLNLSATIHMFPCPVDKERINKVFEPLGYEVNYETFLLDNKFPEWGDSKYVNLTVSGNVVLRDLLKQIILLIPVFDKFKHYDVSNQDELNKLLKLGDGWLSDHPEKDFIVNRYLQFKKGLVNKAQEHLKSDVDEIEESIDKAVTEKEESLNTTRFNSVINELIKIEAKSVLDIGCSNGKLLEAIRDKMPNIKLAGIDVHLKAVSIADKMANKKDLDKIDFFQSSILYKDKRFKGYDAVTAIEVMEHIDEFKLYLFEKVLFGYINPRVAILTTPNKDYNENYDNINNKGLRHFDHRFEFTKREFESWVTKICSKYGYIYFFKSIGKADEKDQQPTLMVTFMKKTIH
jgi:3'' terminal RNA ribose 2''-O-methyltransferase Hen1